MHFFPTFFPQEASEIQLPEGLRDLTPPEAEKRRTLTEKFRDTLNLWGYREVSTPTLEFESSLSRGVGREMTNRMFKLQDVDGEIIALRAEMTAPVARLVSSRLDSWPKPIRLFYIGSVFKRTRRSWEESRETLQGGAELMGAETPHGEVEILILLKDLLERLEVPEATIDLGHSTLFKRLVKPMPEQKRVELMNYLRRRDKKGLTNLLGKVENPEEGRRIEAIIDLLEATRLEDAASIISEIEELNRYSSELEELGEQLQDLGVTDGIGFDITLIRNLEYYTGIVFEVITPSLGVPIGGGGRYDNLIEKFGAQATQAIGFALDLDMVSKAAEITSQRERRILILGDPKTAYRISGELRNKGISAATSREMDEGSLLSFAETWGYAYIVKVESLEEASILELDTGRSIKIPLSKVAEEVGQLLKLNETGRHERSVER
ncbi:MAG: ATP phosphoribosyltransferase regulatory subunit [Candidatus Bathyarchaeia archaeon]